MSEENFVVREVRNGRVKIKGNWFYPEEKWMKYDGRLDNQRFSFGLYYRGNELEPFVSLWGTEKEYHGCIVSKEEQPYIIGGLLPWIWWNRKDSK